MGAGSWPPLKPLFRMIPGFAQTRSARECATTTTPAPAGPGRAAPRWCGPTRASVSAVENSL